MQSLGKHLAKPKQFVRHVEKPQIIATPGYIPVQQPTVLPSINLEGLVNTMLTTCYRNGEEPFIAEEREKGERLKYVLHASELSKCAARVFFKVIRIQDGEDIPPRTLRIFGNGHAVHRRLQGYLIEVAKRRIGGITGYWENIRIAVPELWITGELDFILEFKNQYRFLVEIKSKKDDLFDKMKKAEEAWIYQGHCYMKSTGVRQSIYLVENKNDQKFKEPNVPWSEKIWAEIVEVANAVNKGIDDSKIPATNTSNCWFCEFRETICPAYKKPNLTTINNLVQITKRARESIRL